MIESLKSAATINTALFANPVGEPVKGKGQAEVVPHRPAAKRSRDRCLARPLYATRHRDTDDAQAHRHDDP
jgi:hypothetical protein